MAAKIPEDLSSACFLVLIMQGPRDPLSWLLKLWYQKASGRCQGGLLCEDLEKSRG